MKILVLNCGSSSLKYQLIDMSNEEVLCVGLVERIGIEGSILKQEKDGVEGKLIVEQPMKNHQDAIKLVLDAVVDAQYGGVKDIKEVEAVGHRVVHGGEKFAGSVLITDEVKAALEECIELAPLHNPANIMGIEACEAILPGVPMVGVFDTAFHQTMPKSSYLYGLPHELYTKYGVRRYGFHGTSHRYVTQRAAAMLGKKLGHFYHQIPEEGGEPAGSFCNLPLTWTQKTKVNLSAVGTQLPFMLPPGPGAASSPALRPFCPDGAPTA